MFRTILKSVRSQPYFKVSVVYEFNITILRSFCFLLNLRILWRRPLLSWPFHIHVLNICRISFSLYFLYHSNTPLKKIRRFYGRINNLVSVKTDYLHRSCVFIFTIFEERGSNFFFSVALYIFWSTPDQDRDRRPSTQPFPLCWETRN